MEKKICINCIHFIQESGVCMNLQITYIEDDGSRHEAYFPCPDNWGCTDFVMIPPHEQGLITIK